MDIFYVVAILAVALVFFVTEWLRVDVVALGVVIALILTGVLETSEAIAGFSSSSVLTIASLFVVGGAVLQTGLAEMIGKQILRVAGTGETRLIVMIMLAVALLSGFMSNTGTVAVLLPAILALARTAKISPSRLMIPLAYGASLGGALTLIGTPPNIIVSDTLRDAGMEPFNFFSFAPMGLILLVSGTIFMTLFGTRLLPDHAPAEKEVYATTPQELLDLYRLPDNIYRLRIRSRSELNGKTLEAAALGEDFDMSVLEILRPPEPTALFKIGGQTLSLESNRWTSIHPQADTQLQINDVLLVQAEESDMQRAVATWTLAIQPISPEDREFLINNEGGIAEVLIPPRSVLAGKTLAEIRFGRRYKLTVLDIRKPNQDEKLDLKETRLDIGDTLLVQGLWSDVLALRDEQRDFVLLGQPEEMMAPPAARKAPIAFLILVGMMLLMMFEVTSVAGASMLASLLVVLTGCLSMDDAYDAIDWRSVVLIAGMLPVSTAMVKVGLVNDLAIALTDSLGEIGPLAVLAGLFIMTSVFTQLLSNTATTVLIAPIALVTAQQLEVQPEAFLMGVAIAASMAFATPVASPVNLLVMNAGNYRFLDFSRIGILMIVISLIVTLVTLPILWPF